MLKLYDYFRSSACFRVRIALNLKALDYEIIPIHLMNNGGEQFSNTYRHINPQCLVPALCNRDKILTQSLAIIEYLEDIHPSPSLLPPDPYEKSVVRSFALSIAADIHPLNNLRVLNYLTHKFNISEEQKTQWYHHWIEKGFSALEKQLTTYQLSGNFCFGNNLTLADIYLVPQMYNAMRFACNLNAYPTLARINTHCLQHPAIMKAWPMDAAT